MSPEFLRDNELLKVEIHATDVCNNRCSFCTTGWLMREQGEGLGHPSRQGIRAKLEEAYAAGARRALFQGGEPTLRRDLGELLADAHAIGYTVTTVFTNARMAASRAGAGWLSSMDVSWFQVSIQGGTAEAHDVSVGAKGAFDQTVAGARRLLGLGQRVKINSVLTVHLLDTLREFAALMIDLGPEEVGLDTVKPCGAFEGQRESYAALVPPMARYSGALRDAMLAMEGAGINARVTSLPACLVPGAEHLVSEEVATTISQHHRGNLLNKRQWKRAMQVKADTCPGCAYHGVCGGVYRPYAELYGLGELLPVAELRAASVREPVVADSALTRALRQVFVKSTAGASWGVRAVRRLTADRHELDCFGPDGPCVVFLDPRSDAPSYARTERFCLTYRSGPGRRRPDERLLKAIVRRLELAERRAPP